jgi:hypothetical protein
MGKVARSQNGFGDNREPAASGDAELNTFENRALGRTFEFGSLFG